MENKPNLFSKEHLLNSRDETEQTLYYLLRGYLKIGFSIFQKIQELKQQANITETSCLESQITDFHYVVLLNTLCIKSFEVLILLLIITHQYGQASLFAGEENNSTVSCVLGWYECLQPAMKKIKFLVGPINELSSCLTIELK